MLCGGVWSVGEGGVECECGGVLCTNYCVVSMYREYLLEVKVRLLEQLSCGFNSPQLAIEFIQMLLDEYSALCNALPALLYLLAPLVSPFPTHTIRTVEPPKRHHFRKAANVHSLNSRLSSSWRLIVHVEHCIVCRYKSVVHFS